MLGRIGSQKTLRRALVYVEDAAMTDTSKPPQAILHWNTMFVDSKKNEWDFPLQLDIMVLPSDGSKGVIGYPQEMHDAKMQSFGLHQGQAGAPSTPSQAPAAPGTPHAHSYSGAPNMADTGSAAAAPWATYRPPSNPVSPQVPFSKAAASAAAAPAHKERTKAKARVASRK